jgi:teichuronic acid biosynthesis glycosyltransferase TuaC
LFPNNKDPKHGIFVRNRLGHLLHDFKDVQAKVIAPVPWFPFEIKSGPMAEYSKFAGVERKEQFNGIEIYHPRFLVLPKIGMYLTPFFLFLAIYFTARNIRNEGYDCDLIDGHYFYPDGVAIALVAKMLGKPFTVTARGTDINLIPQYPLARRLITKVARQAAAIITVCQALKDSLLEFAQVGHKTTALRNGVDLTFFTATDKNEQQQLKQYWCEAEQKLIVSVGHLIERKGHHLVIEALLHAPDCYLVIAGDGPEQNRLEALVDKLELRSRVQFAGALSQSELKTLYQSADALVLASSREGWANVLLESMACGTAVVATNLWGTPEVVAAPEAGVLVDRDPKAMAVGLETLFARDVERSSTRKYAEGFDWFATSKGQYDIFSRLIDRNNNNPKTESN